jgi:hypothetical protein
MPPRPLPPIRLVIGSFSPNRLQMIRGHPVNN